MPMYIYQVLHHFPLNQIVRQIVPVAYQIPVEHRINTPYPVAVPVEQKIIIPQAVPYGVQVPIPVPVPYYNSTINSNPNNNNNLNDLETEFNSILAPQSKRDIKQITYLDQDTQHDQQNTMQSLKVQHTIDQPILQARFQE